MHGRLGSGARCLNCVMSVHLDAFFVCTSSEDWPVCACVCTHAQRGQSLHARTHNERVHMCAYMCAHMCTHSLCVRAVNTLASVRMHAHLHGPSLWKLQ